MSPRPGPRRPLVAVRLSATGLEVLDDMASQEGVTRSEMIRTLLAEAIQARQRPGRTGRPKKETEKEEQR